jgi:hypothetical protein
MQDGEVALDDGADTMTALDSDPAPDPDEDADG